MRVIAITLLRIYKYTISPLLPPSCRFTPTCSEYAMDAIARYGAWKGFKLGFKRVLRCHPFGEGGYDPLR
jgi:uncharacterized protein